VIGAYVGGFFTVILVISRQATAVVLEHSQLKIAFICETLERLEVSHSHKGHLIELIHTCNLFQIHVCIVLDNVIVKPPKAGDHLENFMGQLLVRQILSIRYGN